MEKQPDRRMKGITRQLMKPLGIFQLLLFLIMVVIIFHFTVAHQMAEKKQVSRQVSGFAAELVRDIPCAGRAAAYACEHRERMEWIPDGETAGQKEQEMKTLFPGYTVPENIAPEQFDGMEEAAKTLFSALCCREISLRLSRLRENMELLSLDAYLVRDGSFFLIGPGGEGREPGTEETYTAGKYPALDRLLGAEESPSIWQNLFDGADRDAVRTFTAVRDENGRPVLVIQAAIAWTGFLKESLGFTALIFGFVLVLIVLQLVCIQRVLSRQVIRPIRKEQQAIGGYMEDKEAEKAVATLSEIQTDNEIQSLAESFSSMASEMERYVKEERAAAAEKERLGTELALASKIQESALPGVFPAFPDRSEFDLCAAMDPMMDIGGDFYDFFLLDPDHLARVIADVSGKAMSAALFMMSSKIMISGAALMGGTPAEILGFVNRQICRNNDANMFVTVWMGILEISTGRLTACNAGHEYPMLLRSGRYEIYRDKHGMGLGMFDAVKYTDYELTLQKGDGLFVYTDGVAEATDADKVLFGTDRTLQALNTDPGASPEQVLKNVRAAIDGFVKEAPQFDDLTMLCLRYNGPEPEKKEIPD